MYDFWETFILSTALGVVHATIKDPVKQARLKDALFNLADTIYESYGVLPPSSAPVVSPATARAGKSR